MTAEVRAKRLNQGGDWRAECSCGWTARTYAGRGARDAALADRWEHELDHETDSRQD